MKMLQSDACRSPGAYQVRIAETDTDFDSIRDDPRFQEMIAEAKKRLGMRGSAAAATSPASALMILIGGSSIWPFIAPSPLVAETGDVEDLLHDVHAFDDVAEGGEAVGVAAGRAGVEARHVATAG